MSIEYINMRIDVDDHNKIFYDIYNNYKKYGFINGEYCKNYLCIIFNEIFDKEINLDLINEMSNKKEITPIAKQKLFRQNVISRFDTCIISDIHHESCQASHIYDLKDDKLNYDINNGILLSATLHMEFDKLKWCIHPYTYKIIISEKHQDQNLEIKKYISVDLQSTLEQYLNMRIYLGQKYQKFIEHNY